MDKKSDIVQTLDFAMEHYMLTKFKIWLNLLMKINKDSEVLECVVNYGFGWQ